MLFHRRGSCLHLHRSLYVFTYNYSIIINQNNIIFEASETQAWKKKIDFHFQKILVSYIFELINKTDLLPSPKSRSHTVYDHFWIDSFSDQFLDAFKSLSLSNKCSWGALLQCPGFWPQLLYKSQSTKTLLCSSSSGTVKIITHGMTVKNLCKNDSWTKGEAIAL